MALNFTRLLLYVKRQLRSDELNDLNLFFDREPSPNDSANQLFTYLRQHGIISDRNVSRLVEGLKEIQLHVVASEVAKYEQQVTQSVSSFRSEIFVGRDEEMDDMHCHIDEIRRGNHGFRAVFISGLPGVGKTCLADEFLQRQMDSHFEQMFVSCRGLRTANSVRNIFMEQFHISVDRERLYKIFEKTVGSVSNKLIVLDNLEEVMEDDGANFDQFLSNIFEATSKVTRRSHGLLMTSRRQLSPEIVRKYSETLLSVNLEKMNERDSLDLLDSYLGQRDLSLDEKKTLMTLCGQHTLSMALVASRLKLSPQIPFDHVASQLRRKPLVTLTRFEEALDTQSCVESSLCNTFLSMDSASQDLLIRLSRAADSIKESTAKNLYRDLSCNVRDLFDESLTRLLELNFIKCRNTSSRGEFMRRFSIHLLIRCFVDSYCNDASCPEVLKTAYSESKELLLMEYAKDMKRLSRTEWQDPQRYNREMEVERRNLVPELPRVLDFMTEDKYTLNNFHRVCDVARHLHYVPKDMANFYLERKKFASKCNAPSWIVAFFELRYADETRLSGLLAKAEEVFKKVKEFLQSDNTDITPEQRSWLDAYYDRYYGRYLKDITEGNFKRALEKSKRYLKSALKKFDNKALFSDVQEHLVDVQCDLGNAYKVLGDFDMSERYRLYNNAKKSYDAARIILSKVNPKTVRLFDIYLSLAACDMELKSYQQSVNGREDRRSLNSVLEYYNKAEEIAMANRDIIYDDNARMSQLHYSRAVCHARAREYTAAHVDASKALRMSLNAFGCHNKTMACYSLLGYIYSQDPKSFCQHNRKALASLEKALEIAQRLAWKGANTNKKDIDRLEQTISIVTFRLRLDNGKYEDIIEAVRCRDLARLKPDNFDNEVLSDEDIDMNDVEEPRHNPRQYRDSSSDSDADSGDGSAPKWADARKLADKLKELMKRNAERLHYLSHFMNPTAMEIICFTLRDNYMNLSDDARNVRYEKGTRLYCQLKNLEDNPAMVIEENRAKRDGCSS